MSSSKIITTIEKSKFCVVEDLAKCRICNNKDLTIVIELGDQIITSRFPVYGDFSTPKTPITLCKCENCGLLQLYQTTNPCELYEYEYGYRSGLNNTMRAHLKRYQEEISSKITINSNDTIVDIGSNDATMLKNWSSDLRRIGVDPTGSQFKEFYKDSNIELIPTYFTIENISHQIEKKSVKVVSSISMFYDLPDPVKFARDIYEILEDDGIWTCEQSYLLTMLKRNSIDTICHEHLEYYALTQIKEIADRSGFTIIDVLFNDCNGGSFRVYFAKTGSSLANTSKCDKIENILLEEKTYGIMSNELYENFIEKCNNEVIKLKRFIETANANKKRIYIYGASTKGNCLLQFAGIGEQHIPYAVERNPNKVGKMTSTGIKIISEEEMRKNPPDYLLVLPWHFRKEIIYREYEFLNGGGQFIFPFPNFEIYGGEHTKRVLITGSSGFIAKYLINEYISGGGGAIGTTSQKYVLYGISRHFATSLTPQNFDFTPPEERGPKDVEKCDYDDNIMTFKHDLLDSVGTEKIICSIKPHIIVHLAGISSAYKAFQNPILSLQTNGMITANICDILYRNKDLHNTYLFNASSSEIYKGHINYAVNEHTINNKHHVHPYSIAKIMGTSIVDFYRDTHKMQFSNGILFTVESHKKSDEFLLNKIANYIRNATDDTPPIVLSSLNSWRNIIHAKDAARAIYLITFSTPDNYIICNNYSVNISDIVIELFAKFGIVLYEYENGKYYNTKTGICTLKIEQNPGFEEKIIDIRGDNTKLRKLGWKPEFSVNDILDEIRDFAALRAEGAP